MSLSQLWRNGDKLWCRRATTRFRIDRPLHSPSSLTTEEVMRRLTVATIVASSLALAACAERDSTSPRSINPGQASFAGGPNSTACSFTNIDKAAKAYFTSNQDPVYSILSTWSTAYKTNPATATQY